MRRRFLLLGRIFLAGIFIYAGLTKVWVILFDHWTLFAMSINSYEVLPPWMVNATALVLPWLEIVMGVFLLAGWHVRWMAAACTALLAGFFAVMLRAHLLGLGIDCGCFGFGEALTVATLVRDGLLLAVALAVTVLAFRAGRAPAQAPAAGVAGVSQIP
jgi:uncharacterized membrane protein YphA (DoxX/SURF4 family)